MTPENGQVITCLATTINFKDLARLHWWLSYGCLVGCFQIFNILGPQGQDVMSWLSKAPSFSLFFIYKALSLSLLRS